ncbi:hypothetical protein DdX_03785 [Ditylenchus destructor]|uniref:Uncharacterized protein n=1 Tax=Ditylenchus destructor TaxID=166010 RepID=A0AAD4NCF0_9BILA|nr:hypothetical protein DdX_03785 [Ditylenchus destructor]
MAVKVLEYISRNVWKNGELRTINCLKTKEGLNLCHRKLYELEEKLTMKRRTKQHMSPSKIVHQRKSRCSNRGAESPAKSSVSHYNGGEGQK